MLSSTLLKAICLILTATLVTAQCDRTCDTLYFAGYNDLTPGTKLTFANPYLGIQYSGYEVRDFTNNNVLTIPSAANALIAYNPSIPTNRVVLTVYQPEIRILDPLHAYLACVVVDKATKTLIRPTECFVKAVGTGPNYYIVEDTWHFVPETRKRSQLTLFNMGDSFNNISTIELHLLNTTAKARRREEVAVVWDEFAYGGRLSNEKGA